MDPYLEDLTRSCLGKTTSKKASPHPDPHIREFSPFLIQKFPSIYQETASKVEGICPLSEYADLFKHLDLLNQDRTSERDLISFSDDPSHLPLYEIPHVLHFIWLGGSLPQKFRDNVAYYADTMKAHQGEVILWTDQLKADPTMIDWLTSHDIRLIPISFIFLNRKSMTTFDQFCAAYYKVPSNYGEASDLLRYEIIDRFGGYYLDCDIHPMRFDFHAVLSVGKKAPYGMISSALMGDLSFDNENDLMPHFHLCCNDNFGAVPKSAFIQNLKEQIICRYQHATKDIDTQDQIGGSWVLETVYRSGPHAFSKALAITVTNYHLSHPDVPPDVKKSNIEKTFFIVPPEKSASSWFNNALNPQKISFKNDGERINRIKHSLVRSLIYEPECLNLAIYYPYLKVGEKKILIEFTEELLHSMPKLMVKIDRIFVDDLPSYQYLKRCFEEKFGKIEWNEKATLHFASLICADDLIDFFLYTQHIHPFEVKRDKNFRVPGYDCGMCSVAAILVERKNFSALQKLLEVSSKEDWLLSTGDLYYLPLPILNSSIIGLCQELMQRLSQQQQDLSPSSCKYQEICHQMTDYQKIREMIQQKINI